MAGADLWEYLLAADRSASWMTAVIVSTLTSIHGHPRLIGGPPPLVSLSAMRPQNS